LFHGNRRKKRFPRNFPNFDQIVDHRQNEERKLYTYPCESYLLYKPAAAYRFSISLLLLRKDQDWWNEDEDHR